MSAATVARLKITLDGVKPAVLRRVEVPFDIRLDRLHLTIQAAMGWTTAIFTSFAPVTSDGAPPFPTSMGEATSSTPARPASTTCSKTSARRR
jgi:hypothetical protein